MFGIQLSMDLDPDRQFPLTRALTNIYTATRTKAPNFASSLLTLSEGRTENTDSQCIPGNSSRCTERVVLLTKSKATSYKRCEGLEHLAPVQYGIQMMSTSLTR